MRCLASKRRRAIRVETRRRLKGKVHRWFPIAFAERKTGAGLASGGHFQTWPWLPPVLVGRTYTTWRLLTSLVDADVQEEGEGVSTSHGSFNLAQRACRGTPERLRQRLVHVTIEVDESLAGWASYMSYEAIVSPRRI